MSSSFQNLFHFSDLSGRTLLVTGITTGIGRALLPYFLSQGMEILAISKGMAQMEAVRRELDVDEKRLRCFECDLADPAAVREAAVAIEQTGVAITAVLHNAAIDPRHKFEDSEDAFWQEVLQVNLLSAVTLTRHLLPIVRRSDQGRIIFMGSILSELGGACTTAYSASKGAVSALTRSLAHELRGTGITVNCLVPGAIRVEREPGGLDERLISWQSIPRRLEPADLAAPLCLLLSRWGGAISGQTLVVDGGILHPIASPEIQGGDL